MKKDYKNWSSSELKYLLEAREARIPYREIARDLGRTTSACTHRFLQYKRNQIDLSEPELAQDVLKLDEPVLINQNHKWLPDEDKKLWEDYQNGAGIEDMVRKYKRNKTALRCRINILVNKKRQGESEPAQEQPTETSVPILSIAIFLISIANAVALYLIMSGKL